MKLLSLVAILLMGASAQAGDLVLKCVGGDWSNVYVEKMNDSYRVQIQDYNKDEIVYDYMAKIDKGSLVAKSKEGPTINIDPSDENNVNIAFVASRRGLEVISHCLADAEFLAEIQAAAVATAQ